MVYLALKNEHPHSLDLVGLLRNFLKQLKHNLIIRCPSDGKDVIHKGQRGRAVGERDRSGPTSVEGGEGVLNWANHQGDC